MAESGLDEIVDKYRDCSYPITKFILELATSSSIFLAPLKPEVCLTSYKIATRGWLVKHTVP